MGNLSLPDKNRAKFTSLCSCSRCGKEEDINVVWTMKRADGSLFPWGLCRECRRGVPYSNPKNRTWPPEWMKVVSGIGGEETVRMEEQR